MATNVVKEMRDKGLITCEPYISEPHYLTIMGSFAYGVSSDTSDMDVYGFCIPPKDIVFPHTIGHIEGFGKQIKRFEVFQQHHIQFKEKEYDLAIYNIVKYYQLCMENNPNMIDSLFTPIYCVLHQSQMGEYTRQHRQDFLHKGSFHKLKGYAFSQIQKAKNKSFKTLFDFCRIHSIPMSEDFDEMRADWDRIDLRTDIKNKLLELYSLCVAGGKPNPKRVESIMKYGWDVKFGYHLIRLVDEAEQILVTGTLDLQRAREHMKAVRSGLISLEEAEKWFAEKEASLEKLYHESKMVPYAPDEEKIKRHLLNCLEMYYGTLERMEKENQTTVKDIVAILKRDGYA